MNLEILKNISKICYGSFYTKIYNIGSRYSSTPCNDFTNPGLNVRLYHDIVPIIPGPAVHEIHKKISNEIDEQTRDESNQHGSGIDHQRLIEHSFNHPKPIKTERIEVLRDKKTNKRKLDGQGQTPPKTKKARQHKFQVI